MATTTTQKIVASVALALAVWAPYLTHCQQPPPNYSYDALPDTSFSCEGRVVGGYYADVESGCQMFHVCGTSQSTSFRFLCPNDTVFDQQHLICANWFQVSCDYTTLLYSRNFEIFKKGAEQEVPFNEIDEDNLPSLEDYDYDFRPSGINRFFSGAGRSLIGAAGQSRVTRPPVTRVPVTRAPVTRAPVTRAPVTRAPVTRAPVTRAPVTRLPVTRAPVTRTRVTQRPVTAAPVTPAPTTERPVSFQSVTRRPVTRRPVTPARPRVTQAPQRFDQTTAATTRRPVVSSGITGFRGRSTFATTTEAEAPSGSRPAFLPTPLPPLKSDQTSPKTIGFRPTRLPAISSSSSSVGSFSSPRRPSQSPAATTASSSARTSPRVTLGEFRSTTASPFQTPSSRVTPGVFRASTSRPVSSTASSASVSTFSTPKPVFTTTGVFPFGFTSVPQQSFAFGTGSRGGFSFGTAVDRNRNRVQSSSASSTDDDDEVASSPQAPPTTAETDFTQNNEVSVAAVATTTTRRPFRPRTARPTTAAPQEAVAVSSAAPFFRPTTTRAPPAATPTRQPTEPTRTVNPVAARFFGVNVVPQTTPTVAATTSAPLRPRGRGRNPFRLAGNDVTSQSSNTDASGRTETTTSPPGGRFSATIPTRSPSTRLSSPSGGEATTSRPRGAGGRPGRRRRPSASSGTSASAAGSRRRGGRRRGGGRLRLSRTGRPRVQSSPAPAENEVEDDDTESISETAPEASSSSSSFTTVQQGTRRPVVRGGSSSSSSAVQQATRRPTVRVGNPVTASRGSSRIGVTRVSTNSASADDSRNEIAGGGAASALRRPLSRPRGRGNRRFNPRLPGGKLNPGKFVRIDRLGDDNGAASDDDAASRIDLSRGGVARPRTPIRAPTGAEFRQELAELTDELGLDEDELELTDEELRLIDDELNSIEGEAERQSFQSIDANNRSIDGGGGRRRQSFSFVRPSTPAPPLRRVTVTSRRVTTPAPPASSAPLIIRKKIRVRGRPSRRPTAAPVVLRRRATQATTTPAPTTETSTLPTNKEASSLSRQNGFFVRPKLQISSALPTDLQARRLNDINSLVAERTGRSRNTSPIAFNRAVRSTTLSTPTEARLSDILFASTSPGGGGGGGAPPAGRPKDSDYDYEYYDSDFRSEHSELLEETESLFQALSRGAGAA